LLVEGFHDGSVTSRQSRCLRSCRMQVWIHGQSYASNVTVTHYLQYCNVYSPWLLHHLCWGGCILFIRLSVCLSVGSRAASCVATLKFRQRVCGCLLFSILVNCVTYSVQCGICFELSLIDLVNVCENLTCLIAIRLIQFWNDMENDHKWSWKVLLENAHKRSWKSRKTIFHYSVCTKKSWVCVWMSSG